MDADKRQLYLDVLEHEQRIEQRAFSALGNFLTANAFSFAAWAVLFTRDNQLPQFSSIDVCLVMLSGFGYLGGLAWGMIGARNWETARRLVAELIRVGGKREEGDNSNIFQILRGVEVDTQSAWNSNFQFGRLSYHTTILSGTPLAVALVHSALLTALLSRKQIESQPIALLAIGMLVGVVVAYTRCRDSRRDAEQAVKGAVDAAERATKNT